MAKKFNLAELLPESERVSDSDTLEIREIPWEKIRANDANFYAVQDVEDLKKSIEMHGLLDPIVVTPAAEEGFYTLISGHRRHKAWGELRKDDPEKYAAIPAIVRRFSSDAMAELALIMANSSARVLSPAEISRQAERVEMLLYDLKEQGYEFTGRMRDQVAKACQVSSSKLARLKVIREKLDPCWEKRWAKNKLPEDTAYALAQAAPEIQQRIFKVWPDTSARGVSAVRKIMEGGNDYTCTGLTGPGCLRCTHGDAFLRHDLEDPWSPCEGKTCCLKCDKATREWSPCSRMCSKAKEKRAAASAKKKAIEEAAREERTSALQRQIRESAIRLVKAADASGADEKAPIRTRYSSTNVAELREIAAGKKQSDWLYSNWLDAEEGFNVRQAAEVLGCSADYVCGLTEELHPAAAPAAAEVQQNAVNAAETQRAAEGGGPNEKTTGWRGWYRVEGPDVPDDGMRCIVWDPDMPYMPDVCIYRDGAFWNRYENAEEYEEGCWWAPWPDMPDEMRDVLEEDEE